MFAQTYPAVISEEAPNEFLVTFPDVPEAITGAPTYAEAVVQAADALAVAIEGVLAEGRQPAPPRPAEAGMVDIALDPSLAARAILLGAMKAQSLNVSGVARRMGQDEKAVRRILTGKGVTLDQSLRALRAVGVRPALAVLDEVVAA